MCVCVCVCACVCVCVYVCMYVCMYAYAWDGKGAAAGAGGGGKSSRSKKERCVHVNVCAIVNACTSTHNSDRKSSDENQILRAYPRSHAEPHQRLRRRQPACASRCQQVWRLVCYGVTEQAMQVTREERRDARVAWFARLQGCWLVLTCSPRDFLHARQGCASWLSSFLPPAVHRPPRSPLRARRVCPSVRAARLRPSLRLVSAVGAQPGAQEPLALAQQAGARKAR